jgi:hypothetical protein
MKFEDGNLRLEATDEEDSSIMGVARRGLYVLGFDCEPINSQKASLVERIFWASRYAEFWKRGVQLRLTDDTGCSFSPDEAADFADLLAAGLKYEEGFRPTGIFLHSDIRVHSMASENLSPDEARQALPVVQQFAGQQTVETVTA